MSIDIFNEQVISLPEARARLPRRPNMSTIFRWQLNGVRGIRLETFLQGGRRYTSVEALERFLQRINGDRIATPAISAATEKKNRKTAAALAQRHGLRVPASAK